MKILDMEYIRKADAYTIENEPIKSVDLMERAAVKCAQWIEKNIPSGKKLKIFCGSGNNGGDGLAIARILNQKNFFIDVFIIKYNNSVSEDFKENFKRLQTIEGIEITEMVNNSLLPEIESDSVIIDAIFGSGLNKPLSGFISKVVAYINNAKLNGIPVISIDIPSGLFADKSSENDKYIVAADFTLTFQMPKLAFFFPENEKYVGNWEILDIGLREEFISQAPAKNYYTQLTDIQRIYKYPSKFAHKGSYGHSLLIAGSYGKIGAAVLASKSCLRSGTGLLTTHIPSKGYEILQTTVHEAMLSIDESQTHLTRLPAVDKYNAIGIGPGIGMDKETQTAVKLLIQNTKIPVVFDADALNILAENKTWLGFLNHSTILTPHPKEFERIAGKSTNDFERHQLQKDLSVKFNCYIVLKGAYTCISTPAGNSYFNSTGNPGMATAGSGDVLTGIITGLLARGYTPLEACLMGVYIHGLAGDFAVKQTGFESLIAEDIINNLGKAFMHVSI